MATNVNQPRNLVTQNDGANSGNQSTSSVNNSNAERAQSFNNSGAEVFPSDTQTVERTESTLQSTNTVTEGDRTFTYSVYSDEVEVRKENGQVRATITRAQS